MTKKNVNKKNELDDFFNKFPTHIDIGDHDKGWEKRPKTMQKWFKKMFGFEKQPSLYNPIVINWSEKGRGFGQYIFFQDKGKIYCRNEHDSKETVMKVLINMVNQAEFLEK